MVRIMTEEVAEFLEIYNRRPIARNDGGIGLNHSFALWRVLRAVRPALVAESGVFRGHSTWMIRQALPECEIFAFDVDFTNRVYVDPRAFYVESDFRDFDWSTCRSEAPWLAFFDDHQNHLDRLKSAYWFGFTYAVLEDNYPPGEGDCYSLRHMAAGVGMPGLQLSRKHVGGRTQQRAQSMLEDLLWKQYWHQSRLVRPNQHDYASILRRTKSITELAPLWLDETSICGRPSSEFHPQPPAAVLGSRLEGDYDYSYNFMTLVEFAR